jgi:hypothetical protein
VIDVVKAAFVQGMLTKAELDARVGQAFAGRTYADLAALTVDVPAGAGRRHADGACCPGADPAADEQCSQVGMCLVIAVTVAVIVSIPTGGAALFVFAPFYFMALLVAGAQILTSRASGLGRFELVLQIGPDSAFHAVTQWPSIRIWPFGRTCQSQPMTVPSPSAAKVSAPEVSIIGLAVREPSRCGRSNPVSSTTIFLPALPMRARNRCPQPDGQRSEQLRASHRRVERRLVREPATVSNTCPAGAAMRT